MSAHGAGLLRSISPTFIIASPKLLTGTANPTPLANNPIKRIPCHASSSFTTSQRFPPIIRMRIRSIRLSTRLRKSRKSSSGPGMRCFVSVRMLIRAASLPGIREFAPDAVFNLFEGVPGLSQTEAFAAGLLEWMGVPYTGCPHRALVLCQDKPLAKRLLKSAQLADAEVCARGEVAAAGQSHGVAGHRQTVESRCQRWRRTIQRGHDAGRVSATH